MRLIYFIKKTKDITNVASSVILRGGEMRIKVQYLGPVRVVVNKREEEIELSLKATIYELLRKLSDVYGKKFEREVFEDNGENVRGDLIVTVNGKVIKQLDGMRTRLKLGDVVSLLPIFAGGG